MSHSLIPALGYITLATGSFLEGETTVILGGIATYQGYLGLPWTIICAFIGTFLGDLTYFYIGYTKGANLIQKRTKPGSFPKKILKFLNKNQVLTILGFRFLYGLRTAILISLGASKIKPTRFILLNTIGSLIWILILYFIGYTFGHSLVSIFKKIAPYKLYCLAGILGTVLALLFSYRRFSQKNEKANSGYLLNVSGNNRRHNLS